MFGVNSGASGCADPRTASLVIHAGLEVLFYGLASALSGLVLSATFVAIRSQRPRTNAIAFLSGVTGRATQQLSHSLRWREILLLQLEL